MSKKLILFLKYFVSISASATLLYFVFRNVEWAEFWQKARTVDYKWVIASILLSIVAYVVRAYRWNILLVPLGYELKIFRTTLAILVGYLANLALPRLGEITRCSLLNRNDRVPVPVALGSVVTERLVDAFTLFTFLIITFIVEYGRLLTFFKEAYNDLNIPMYLLVAILTVGIIGLIVCILIARKLNKLQGKFARFLKDFINGMLSLKDIKNVWGFILSTITLWITYYLMSYIIVFSLPETVHLSLGAGWMLLVVGGVAIAIPVQSGFGTYHGMIAGILLTYSIDEGTGIFLATLLHTSQIVTIALFGSLALIISLFISKKTGVSNQK